MQKIAPTKQTSVITAQLRVVQILIVELSGTNRVVASALGFGFEVCNSLETVFVIP